MPKISLKVHGRSSNATTDGAHIDDESDETLGFPLTVDLSPCLGPDARCRVWVCPRRARRVRWLAARLRRLARIAGAFVMVTSGELLPPDEPLKLLRCTDTLRIARVEHEWQHPFSFPEIDEYSPEAERPEPTASVDSSQIVPQSTPAQTSPRACRPTASKDVTRRTPPPVVVKARERSPDETLQRVKRRALALLNRVAGEGEVPEGEDAPEREGTDDVDAPKKRRRRVRRRRPARPLSPLEPDPVPNEPSPSPVETSSPLPNPEPVTSAPMTQSLPSPEPPLVRSSSVGPPALPARAAVLRTASLSRAPRVVRALSVTNDVIVTADVTVGGAQ